MKLTELEIQMIMEQRAMEAREHNAYAEPTGYERGASMLGQALQNALNMAIESNNPDVAAAADKTARLMEQNYENWDKVVEDTAFVNRLREFMKVASVKDNTLLASYDLVDSGIKDMSLSDADFKAMDEASRNNMKDDEEFSRKTSNVDGKVYVVKNSTGEYYTEEQWESNNTQEVQAHTLGWMGEVGIENPSFNESLPSK